MLFLSLLRQLTNSRERIATGLKKILETNELVARMEVCNLLHGFSLSSLTDSHTHTHTHTY